MSAFDAAPGKPFTFASSPPSKDGYTASKASIADEQSLTSFPSLSASVENSPSTQRNGRRGRSASHDSGQEQSDRNVNAFESLFNPTVSERPRNALFDDAPKNSRHVPGALHHQEDEHIQHLLNRVGPVNLVKQLAEDLAQRDAHVTLLQRRAEERERLLRKMLRECEVSNLDIESRLRELQASRRDLSYSGTDLGSKDGTRADDGIDDRIFEALGDKIQVEPSVRGVGHGNHGEARNVHRLSAASSLRQQPASRRSDSQASSSRSREEVNGTWRGWRSYWAGGKSKKAKDADNTSGPAQAPPDDRDVDPSAISTASQGNIKQSGNAVTSDAATEEDTNRNSGSVTSWALKFIGASTQFENGQSSPNATGQVNKVRDKPLDPKTKSQASASMNYRSDAQSVPIIRGNVSKQVKSDAIAAERHRSSSDPWRVVAGSPGERMGGDDGPPSAGPVEMDTILPDDIRPPTLAGFENKDKKLGYLTDRFGFIYDQRHRRRQSDAALRPKIRPGVPVETLENHRRSAGTSQIEDDALSLESQESSQRPRSSSSSSRQTWQDYLWLPSGLGAELLSDAPAVNHDGIINEGEQGRNYHSDGEEMATGSTAVPQFIFSTQGAVTLLTSNPLPSPTKIVSENAEIAKPVVSGSATPVTSPDQEQFESVKTLRDQLLEVHDSLQRDKTKKWNEFSRRMRIERHQAINSQIGRERHKNSISLPEEDFLDGELIGVAGLGNKGKVGRAKFHEFRHLVLGGVPVTYRAKIWMECSGAASMRVPSYYEELVKSDHLDGGDPEIAQQIQMDITRTLTDNVFFRQGTGVKKLKEVLLAYARRNPDIGYCQGMNLITANLLLIMPTAEDAFWLLACLVENILPKDYYNNSLLTSRADQNVLRHYVSMLLPNLSAHLNELGIELEAATFQWFLSVFSDCFSAEALFRIWDVVFCLSSSASNTNETKKFRQNGKAQQLAEPSSDGSTFLFQTALALLKLNENQLLQCDSPIQVYAYLGGKMTDHPTSIDGLIRASDGLRRFVRRDEVLQKRAEAVERERETVREREKIRKGKGRMLDADSLNSGKTPQQGNAVSSNTEHQRSKEGAKSGRISNHTLARTISDTEEEIEVYGELQVRSPMPVEEEATWHG